MRFESFARSGLLMNGVVLMAISFYVLKSGIAFAWGAIAMVIGFLVTLFAFRP